MLFNIYHVRQRQQDTLVRRYRKVVRTAVVEDVSQAEIISRFYKYGVFLLSPYFKPAASGPSVIERVLNAFRIMLGLSCYIKSRRFGIVEIRNGIFTDAQAYLRP